MMEVHQKCGDPTFINGLVNGEVAPRVVIQRSRASCPIIDDENAGSDRSRLLAAWAEETRPRLSLNSELVAAFRRIDEPLPRQPV